MPNEYSLYARLRRLITAALYYLHEKKGIKLELVNLEDFCAGSLDPLYPNSIVWLRYFPTYLPVGVSREDNIKNIRFMVNSWILDSHCDPDDSPQLQNCYGKIGEDDYVMLRLVEIIYKNIKQYLAE